MDYSITWAVKLCVWKRVQLYSWWQRRQVLPGWAGRVFEGGSCRDESRCSRWFRQKKQKRRLHEIFQRNTQSIGNEGMRKTLTFLCTLRPTKKKIISCPAYPISPLLTWSQPSDINWRIKCFSVCGKVFHPETAIENLAKSLIKSLTATFELGEERHWLKSQ